MHTAPVTITVGELQVDFQIDDYTRWRLLEGLDDISLTLQNEQAIRVFNEAVRQYNAAIAQFPANLLAWVFGFKAARVL